MKKNRLKLSMAAFAALTALSLSGCGQKNSEITEAAVSQEETTEQAVSENKQIRVVTTIFPEYDWVKQIAGDEASNMDLKLLLDNGVDLHSYQPTAEDIMKISDCDLFVYVGGESDTWVDGALKEAVNKDMKVINLLDVLKDTIKTEEAMPGMQNEEGHNHGYSHFADSDVQDRSLEDWTGDWQSVYPYLENGDLNEVMKKKAESGEKTVEEYKQYYETGYKTDVEKIVIDGANGTMEFTKDGNAAKGTYEYRGYQIYDYKSGSRGVRYFFEKTSGSDEAPRYVQFSDHGIAPGKAEHFHIYAGNESFDALSEEMDNWPTYYPADMTADEIKEDAKQKTLLFGDRFPFRYLVDDYGLSYYAAFAGCSAESEASFETISFLAKKVDELGLKNIMTIEKSDQKIAKTIIENTATKDQKILTLDSMQSTTSDDIANGETYLSAMEKNLEVLKEALQ